jgi:hypothetical protein
MRTAIAIATIFCLATSAFAATVSSSTYDQVNCNGTITANSTAQTAGECIGTNTTVNGANVTTYGKITWGSTVNVLGGCVAANCTSCTLNQNVTNSGNANSVCWNTSNIAPGATTSVKFTYSSSSIISAIVLAISFLFFF